VSTHSNPLRFTANRTDSRIYLFPGSPTVCANPGRRKKRLRFQADKNINNRSLMNLVSQFFAASCFYFPPPSIVSGLDRILTMPLRWFSCLKSTFWSSKFIEFTRCNPSLIRSTNATLNGCRSPFRTNRPKPTTIVVFATTVFDQNRWTAQPRRCFFRYPGDNQHTLPVEKTVRIVHTALSFSLSYSLFQQIQQTLTEWTQWTTCAMVLATLNQTGEKTVRTVQSSKVRAMNDHLSLQEDAVWADPGMDV
jgi:hypothetical protein